MKRLLIVLLIGYTASLTANNGVDSVTVEVEMEEELLIIKQSIFITVVDELDDFLLRALPDEDSQLFIDTIHIDQQPTSFETVDMTPTLDLKFNVSKQDNRIDVYYRLNRVADEITVPLFFTSLSALNSEADFFYTSIFRTIDQHFNVVFPRVPIEEKEDGMNKTSSFSLPAAPSMIRLKRVDSTAEADDIHWVDWIVGMVFLLIGLILWINRKKLSYG